MEALTSAVTHMAQVFTSNPHSIAVGTGTTRSAGSDTSTLSGISPAKLVGLRSSYAV